MHIRGDSEYLDDPEMLFSGCCEENDGFAGVGLLLSKKAKDALVFVNQHSSRILQARFKGQFAHITVIVAYIPHQGRTVEPVQQTTYSELEAIIKNVPEHDCLVVMGDFNSRLARSDKNNSFADIKLVGMYDNVLMVVSYLRTAYIHTHWGHPIPTLIYMLLS